MWTESLGEHGASELQRAGAITTLWLTVIRWPQWYLLDGGALP